MRKVPEHYERSESLSFEESFMRAAPCALRHLSPPHYLMFCRVFLLGTLPASSMLEC